MNKKNISIGFLGNIEFDTRTYNLFHSLKSKGYNVRFNGFDWLTKDFVTKKNDEINVEKLTKTKFSLKFYLQFGYRLLKILLKQKADVYFASDIYSLPFCVIAAKLKRKKVFYDSREVYTELPAIQTKKIVKILIKIIERHYIKKTNEIFTTGKLDSLYIEKLYGLEKTYLLRNLPRIKNDIIPVDFVSIYNTEEKIKLLYQGIIVKGRGIETYLEVIKQYSNAVLILLGGGEDLEFYKEMAKGMGIEKNVIFAGKVSQNEILNYTAGADVGLSVIDNVCMNNYYALPNKLFEYLMAGLPVIVSNLPQMAEIVENYNVGAVVNEQNPGQIIEILERWKNNPSELELIKENTQKASAELNWENEFVKIEHLF